MTAPEAAQLLELPGNATPEQIEARFNELRAKLEEKIGKAPTPGLKAKYRESLDEITTAFETLTLAADSSALPVLNKPSAVSSQPSVGSPGSREPATSSLPAHPSPKKRSGGGEFLIVAVIAVVVLAGGGWWVMKTRAEKAEQARIAAEAKAESDRVAAATKAEADRKAEEARLAAEAQRRAGEEENARVAAAAKAEQERREKVMAQASADVANLRIAWEAAEQELRRTERRLAELRSEERNLATAAKGGTTPDLLRLRAKIAAHVSFQDWLEKQLGRHEARVLRVQAEAMVSARQHDEAARLVAQAAGAQAALERDITAMREETFNLAGSLAVRVSPAHAEWGLTDIHGTRHTGRGQAVLETVPWGPVTLEASFAGYAPRRVEGVHRRREALELGTEFKPVTLRIDSVPRGAEIRLAGQSKGTTPATIEWAGDGPLELTLRLRGHATVSQKLDLVSGGEVNVGPVVLAAIPAGLVRPDFARGLPRYVRSGQYHYTIHNTDNSTATQDTMKEGRDRWEARWEIVSPTGLVADATRVVVTPLDENGAAQPGGGIEYQRSERGWIRADGTPATDPAFPERTPFDRPEWWPMEPKKVGETWDIPIAALRGITWISMGEESFAGKVAGRVVQLRLDETQQRAEVRINYDVTSVSASGVGKYRSIGFIDCTLDLGRGFVSSAVQDGSTVIVVEGAHSRLKDQTTSRSWWKMQITPL